MLESYEGVNMAIIILPLRLLTLAFAISTISCIELETRELIMMQKADRQPRALLYRREQKLGRLRQ